MAASKYTYEGRPKWAAKLNERQWQELKVCQQRLVPTRTNLVRDLRHQRSSNMRCYSCLSAARALGIREAT